MNDETVIGHTFVVFPYTDESVRAGLTQALQTGTKHGRVALAKELRAKLLELEGYQMTKGIFSDFGKELVGIIRLHLEHIEPGVLK